MGFPKNLVLLPLAVPLAILVMAAGPAPKSPDAAGPEPLVAALEPGPLHDAVAHGFLQPYADATATPLGLSPFDGTIGGLKSLSGPQAPDLALVDGATLADGCEQQVFTRLDWNALQREPYLSFAAGACGAGAYVAATVLAFDRDKLHADPNWRDFWDVAKYPGRRALRKSARGTLEIALMADGVSPGDVYKALRSKDGVDRAFRKLDQLKPYIEWWDQPAEPGQDLAAGKVLLTSASAHLLPAHGKKQAGIHWGGCLNTVYSWAVPQAAPHAKAALAALKLTQDAARQAAFATATGLGPATKDGVALLPDAQRGENPSVAAHLDGCVPVDESFWLENGEKLDARFAAWASK